MSFPITHEQSVYVDVAPDVVWQLANDIARYPQWVEATLEILEVDSAAAPGVVYLERTRLAGPVTTRSRWTVAEFDEERMFQRHIGEDLPGLRALWVEMRVVPDGRGARFTLSFGLTVSIGPFSRLIGAGLRRTLVEGNTHNAERFARLAEALAAGSAEQ